MSMGVYIDIEMPKEGFVEILIRDDGTVQQTGQSYRIDGTDYYTPYVGEMPKMFTAIPVPAHGRSIDADALLMRINHEVMEAYMDGVCYGVHPSQEYLDLLGEIIDDAPTIIPAEPAEDGVQCVCLLRQMRMQLFGLDEYDGFGFEGRKNCQE